MKLKAIVLNLLILMGFASAGANGKADEESLAAMPKKCSLNGNMATDNVTLKDGPAFNLALSPIEFLANYYSQVKCNWQSRRNLENLSSAVAECQCEDDLMPVDVCYVDEDGLPACEVASLVLSGCYLVFCYVYVAVFGVVFYCLWLMWVGKPRRRQQPVSGCAPLTKTSGDVARFVDYDDPVGYVDEVVDESCPNAPLTLNGPGRRVPRYTFYSNYVVYEQYAEYPNLKDYDDFVLDDNYPLYIVTYL